MDYIRNRSLRRVTAPLSEPLTLAEAKLYLRVDDSSDDTLISDLITAARMAAEAWLKHSLMTQGWQLTFDGSYTNNPLMLFRAPSALSHHHRHWLYDTVRLPMGPVQSVSGVIIINRDSSTQTVDPSSYYLSADAGELILTSITSAFRTQISYSAGFGDASAVPKPVKQGMLAHIADMYDNRGHDGDLGLPEQTLRLYMPMREVRL